MGNEDVGELVVEIGDAGGAFLGEGAGNAAGNFGSLSGGGESHGGHENS